MFWRPASPPPSAIIPCMPPWRDAPIIPCPWRALRPPLSDNIPPCPCCPPVRAEDMLCIPCIPCIPCMSWTLCIPWSPWYDSPAFPPSDPSVIRLMADSLNPAPPPNPACAKESWPMAPASIAPPIGACSIVVPSLWPPICWGPANSLKLPILPPNAWDSRAPRLPIPMSLCWAAPLISAGDILSSWWIKFEISVELCTKDKINFLKRSFCLFLKTFIYNPNEQMFYFCQCYYYETTNEKEKYDERQSSLIIVGFAVQFIPTQKMVNYLKTAC